MKKSSKNGSAIGSVAIIVGLIAMVTLSLCTMHKKPNPALLWWNLYSISDTNTYMEISESQTVGSGPERTVEIMLSTNTLSGISGHDFNTDGVWDEITWCGYDTNRSGANSYVRTKKGWKWQPCDIDKKYAPINEAEIANAIKSLDAVLTNRSINNLKRVWTYNSTTDLSR